MPRVVVTLRSLRSGLRAAGGVSALALILGTSMPAAAQPASSNGKVAAEALFEQGRSLMAENKFADACPRFADSQKLDPSPGTLLNLANCYEKLGRTATAWATYREAASAANAANRADYVASAQRHADALAPKLAKLTATVAQPVDGLQVRRDGVEVLRAEWGVPIPIDSGTHTIDASAPGFKPWSQNVDVTQDGAQVNVTVPALEAAPPSATPVPAPTPAPAPAPTPAPAPPPDTSRGSGQRVAGLIVGGVGVLGLGASGLFAILAKNKYNDSLQNCPSNPNVCTQTGVNQRNDALTDGNVASIAFGVGAAALVGGVVLYLTAPSASSTASGAASGGVRNLQVSPLVGLGTGGAVLGGAW
jgi:tetratricopeptide (TPR) repeat protein